MTCDPKRIELFLAQKLSDDEQTAFELHLDDCRDCRRQLESMAAGEAVWSGVREALLGEQPPPAGLLSGDAALDWAAGGDAAFCQTTVLKLLAPTDDDRMLGRLGTYEVVGVIGSGGMGVVLKAFDAALNRYVAIKVLAPHLGSSGAARKRFSREAQAAAAVVHDNVVEIHGVADVEGLPYLVMPYVRGPSLQRRLDDDGPLAVVEILRIGMQAAAGLAAAHAQGLVHRDVKPANILLADGIERVKLTDFGLARAADDASLTRTGIIAGTPQYMSPEQARGESLDHRSDLFSLGSVLYAMGTGRAPFRAETSYGVLRRVTDEEPRPMRQINPDIPEWLCRIVARLMSKQPDGRFASAREVAELLEACLAHVQQPTAVPLPASLGPRSRVRRLSISRRSTGAIVMTSAISVICIATVLWQASHRPEADESRPASSGQAAQTESSNTNPEQSNGAQIEKDEPPRKATDAAPKLVRRFTDLTTGHDIKIACLADGKRIIIANGNPTIIHDTSTTGRVAGNWKPSAIVLDAVTGKTVVSLKLSTADEDAVLAATERITHFETTALAFSPKGDLVAIGTSIGQVKLFDAQTGKLIRSLDDEDAKIADPKTPEEWKTISRAMGSVASLAFSPEGSLLATCGGSFADFSECFDGVRREGFRRTGPGRLKLWDVETGTLKHDLPGHNDQAYAVAFSPDGQLLASAGRWMTENDLFGNGVLIWNPNTGEQIHSLIRTTADAGARAIAFSPDSKMLAMGTQRFGDGPPDSPSTGGVSLIHVSSGIEEWLVTVPGWASPLAFTPDGKSVAVLCGGQSIRFLETETGKLKHEIRPADSPRGVRWNDLALPLQGQILAVGGVDKERKGSVEVFSTRNGDDANPPAAAAPATSTPGESNAKSIVVNFKTGASVKSIACSENGKFVAVANGGPTLILHADGTSRVKDNWKPSAEIFDAHTGKLVVALKLTHAEENAVLAATRRVSHLEVTALALSSDGSLVAVGTSIGQVKIFMARTGELIRTLDDEAARLADENTPENWKSLARALGSVASLAFSPDGNLLATCGSSFADYASVFDGRGRLGERATGPGRLKLWDVKTGALEHDLAGHSDANAVAFSPDGNLLASAGSWFSDSEWGTGVILWDPETGKKVRTISTEANGGAQSVAFSPDGKLLAISSLIFDKDKSNDAGTSAISLVHAATGIVDWQRTLPGVAKPGFSDRVLYVLSSGKLAWFLEQKTGQTLSRLRPNPEQRERWNDFALAKKGRMWVLGGENDKHQGTVEVMDPDNPGTVHDSAPAKDGEDKNRED